MPEITVQEAIAPINEKVKYTPYPDKHIAIAQLIAQQSKEIESLRCCGNCRQWLGLYGAKWKDINHKGVFVFNLTSVKGGKNNGYYQG